MDEDSGPSRTKRTGSGGGPRSKVKTGCLTCKKRRVKCDEGRPACQRCMSTGRICDGYGIWGGGSGLGASSSAHPSLNRDRRIGAHAAAASYGSSASSSQHLQPPSRDASASGPTAVAAGSASSGHVLTLGPLLSSDSLDPTGNHIGDAEKQAYDYFRARTTLKLPGVFGSWFWERLVIQASASEPAVLHAVVAMGAAHRGGATTGNSAESRAARQPGAVINASERLALQQYNKAIEHLSRQMAADQDKTSTQVALISCLIFVCIELIWGEFKTAQRHLQMGLGLLREVQRREKLTTSDGAVVLRLEPESVDDYLVEAFTRLNVQSALFGQGSTYLYSVGDSARAGIYSIPQSFSSTRSARQYLDGLMNGVYLLTSEARDFLHSHEHSDYPENFVERRHRLQGALETWLRAYEASQENLTESEERRTMIGVPVPEYSRSLFGVPLLKLYHTMTVIMAATCLRGTDELVFDEHNITFASILEQAVKLWRVATVTAAFPPPGCDVPELSFTADMGFIPAIYYTAVKCRVPHFRRQAINLLLSAPHREGVWDGTLAASIAQKIMDMEEAAFYDGIHIAIDPDALADPLLEDIERFPPIPNDGRTNEVTVQLPDDVVGKAKLVCSFYRMQDGEGVWESRTTEFDIELGRGYPSGPRVCRM